MLEYNRNLKENARWLRATMTHSEQLLWSKLRGKQMVGVQFYKQKPIGTYIVDFYAPRAKLVVEVDGSQHLDGGHAQNDALRDAYLTDQGLRVLRFGNLQVFHELDGVMEVILCELSRQLDEIPPNPPLRKGGSPEGGGA